MSYALKVVDGI